MNEEEVKDCIIDDAFGEVGDQVNLTNQEVKELYGQFMAEQMQKIADFTTREFIENWLMYGEGIPKPEVSQEMEDLYQNAYAAHTNTMQWEEADIDQRFIMTDCLYQPEPDTVESWKERIKIMARDLKKYQIKYNNEILGKNAL